MLNKNHWAVPGFSTLALVALSACSGGGGGSGGGGTGLSAPAADFDIPNVYADYNDDNAEDLGNLVVFGDSYSDPDDPKRGHIEQWSEKVVGNGDASSLESYALGEASANSVNVYFEPDINGNDPQGDDPNNTFANQVDQWLANNPTLQSNDLTVVYMGYNDVNKLSQNNGDLDAALNDYETELDRILDEGAANGDRRVFVTLIHDWGSTPSEYDKTVSRCGEVVDDPCNFKRERTKHWNDALIELANANDNVVAVDMFTVFERITADPAAFGFDNITTADPDNSGSTSLYFDGNHFGDRGQEILAQVFNHYMTRGWDWSNTLSAGSAAVAQLNEDIDNGLAMSLNAIPADRRLGFNSFAIGDIGAQMAALNQETAADPARSGYAKAHLSETPNTGVGLNYGLRGGTNLGIVMSNYNDNDESGYGAQSTNLDYESSAVSFYLDTEMQGLQFRTTASYADETFNRREYDQLADSSNSANFGGETVSLSQKVSAPSRLGQAWVTPWLDVTHTHQSLDSYTISNPYLTDTTYDGKDVSETWATLGLDTKSDRFAINDETGISFNAGLSYRQSLFLDDYEVNISETGLAGQSQNEVIQRDSIGIAAGHIGANVDLSEQLGISTGYEVSQQTDAEPQHSVTVRLNYAF